MGAGCVETLGGHALCLHLCTHSGMQTHALIVAAKWGNTEGIKHLALLECLPWKQTKDNMCQQAPGSLPLAIVYPGEILILRGNLHCRFYVSRMRVSTHFLSAGLPCTPRERIPTFFLLSPHSLQAAGSFIRDVQWPEGRQLLERMALGFFAPSWK